MRRKKLTILLLVITSLFGLPNCLWAGPKINVEVKAILASQGQKYVDPKLSNNIHEVKSVFKYSSYRLLSQSTKTLRVKETGTVSLPGNRILKIKPLNVGNGRADLRLIINKDNKKIFQTQIQLLNHRSIIVGGPKYKGGYLMFKISTSF